MPGYLAVDLGAESGRVLRGDFDGARLVVEEVHRFPNDPLRRPGELCWDIERLYREVLGGIARKAKSPWTFINPVRYYKVNDGAASSLQIGDGTGQVALAAQGVAQVVMGLDELGLEGDGLLVLGDGTGQVVQGV